MRRVDDDPRHRFAAAIAAIDAANSEDPETIVRGGERRPKELVHAELVTDWVLRLDPGADEAQLLAARAHHFRRWTTPRADFPEGRAGYLRWRTGAAQQHAAEVARLLGEHGYGSDEIERVASIIRKERRTSDPAVQTHEDALCLVFIETQLDDVSRRLGEDQALSVLTRTVSKMSPAGVDAALRLELDPSTSALLHRAVRAAEAPAQAGGGTGAAQGPAT